jgi:hypothetical protein
LTRGRRAGRFAVPLVQKLFTVSEIDGDLPTRGAVRIRGPRILEKHLKYPEIDMRSLNADGARTRRSLLSLRSARRSSRPEAAEKGCEAARDSKGPRGAWLRSRLSRPPFAKPMPAAESARAPSAVRASPVGSGLAFPLSRRGGARGVSARLTSEPAVAEGHVSRSERPAGRG